MSCGSMQHARPLHACADGLPRNSPLASGPCGIAPASPTDPCNPKAGSHPRCPPDAQSSSCQANAPGWISHTTIRHALCLRRLVTLAQLLGHRRGDTPHSSSSPPLSTHRLHGSLTITSGGGGGGGGVGGEASPRSPLPSVSPWFSAPHHLYGGSSGSSVGGDDDASPRGTRCVPTREARGGREERRRGG